MGEMSLPSGSDYTWSAAQSNENEIKRAFKLLTDINKRLIELEAQVVILQRRFNGYPHAVKKEISRSR